MTKMPGIVTGAAFVFSLSVSMYVIPSLIVGERQSTLSMLIARSFLYFRDAQLGSTISAVLLVIAIAVVLTASWPCGEPRRARPDARGPGRARLRVGGWPRWCASTSWPRRALRHEGASWS